jgi:sugar phosphate permease
VLLGAGMLGVETIRDYDLVVACVFMNQFGSGVLLPTLVTRVVNAMPAELRGRGSGRWMSCLFLGQFVNPLIVLAAAALLSGLLQAVTCFGVVSLASGGVILLVSLGRRQQAAT